MQHKSMTKWSYVILERDDKGIVIDSIDATDEVLFLYSMIERQEKILQSYRKELGITFSDDPLIHH